MTTAWDKGMVLPRGTRQGRRHKDNHNAFCTLKIIFQDPRPLARGKAQKQSTEMSFKTLPCIRRKQDLAFDKGIQKLEYDGGQCSTENQNSRPPLARSKPEEKDFLSTEDPSQDSPSCKPQG